MSVILQQGGAQKEGEKIMEYVYLIPRENITYSAQIASAPPVHGIELVELGSFPVELTVRRTDISGSSVLVSEWCNNRDELLSALNWNGGARNSIVELWHYNIETASDELSFCFNNLSNWKVEIARADAELYRALHNENSMDFMLVILQFKTGDDCYPHDTYLLLVKADQFELFKLEQAINQVDEEDLEYEDIAETALRTLGWKYERVCTNAPIPACKGVHVMTI